MITRRLLTRCAGGLIAFVAAYVVLLHPVAFPQSLAEPSFQIDQAEGHVWLTSEIVFEVRGNVSEEEALQEVRLTPPVKLEKGSVTVEHEAMLPWHESMPWAKTRVRVNPGHGQIFQSETSYGLAFQDFSTQFRTITLPRVVQFEAQNPPAPDLTSVPTSSEIVLQFNEPLRWDPSLIKIEPPAPFTAQAAVTPEGSTVVRVLPAARWDNSTNYTVRVDATLEDVHGHVGGEVFAHEFTTEPRPQIIAATPVGESVPIDTPVRIQFDRDVDHASVEASFRTDPPFAGAFGWENERTMVWWRTPEPLPFSTHLKVSVAGNSPGGDAVVPYEWTYRTYDPPVFVEVRGRRTGPTVLEAVATGGVGSYAFHWNTGNTSPRMLFKGAPGPQVVEVVVQSGDRINGAAIEVIGPPPGSYTPLDCPPGWELLEVSVCYRRDEVAGVAQTFLTRVDLKDPGIQVGSAPAGDRLGSGRTVSEKARMDGAVAALNGDFFYRWNGGVFPLGPIVQGGNIVTAPPSPQAVLAFSNGRGVWTGSAGELQFSVQAGDGSSIAIQGVNHIPVDNSMSIFNSYWGNSLNAGGEGCIAWFFSPGFEVRAPDQFSCGELTQIGLPAGGYALVARGAAAWWLQAHAGSGLAAGYTFPLGELDFMVGGSQVLMKGGAPSPLGADVQHPRSMIGVDGEGFLYMVAVDGRSEDSGGMSLQQLQAYAAALGLQNAINLDGGGSTTMAIWGNPVNRPSDGKERAVASIIEVRLAQPACRHPFVRCQ